MANATKKERSFGEEFINSFSQSAIVINAIFQNLA